MKNMNLERAMNTKKRQEIQFLKELNVYEVVDIDESNGHRLYKSKFLDKIKNTGEKHSRLCAAAWNDQEHGLFTAAPTIRRLSLRLLFALCATYKYAPNSRDVVRAFLRAKTKLRRPIYMKAPKEMGLKKGQVLKVLLPLYGMPESPIHWYKTYIDHHKEEMDMNQSLLDPCLLYKHSNQGELIGILGLQVDDTVFAGTQNFLKEEEAASKLFPNKGRSSAETEELKFNGVNVKLTPGTVVVQQRKYLEQISKTQKSRTPPFEEFRSVRAKYAYAAYSTMPDILIFVARLSQVTKSMYEKSPKQYIKILMKLEKVVSGGPSLHGLKYVRLPMHSVEVFVCIDASFAVNEDNTSQVGVLAMLRNPQSGACNVIHYVSQKTKRVDLTIATDSRSLFCLAITLGQTTERRLQIDLAMIREAYERREIAHLVWISGKTNPADDLTKCAKRNGTLATILSSNRFNPDMESWVKRDCNEVRTSMHEKT
eukprot:IDg23256t1